MLLTLLCLEFEESSEFPESRAELYERGLNIMLSKWDGQRRIKRDEVYKRLSIQRKASLLGQLAMHTFERGEYFFREYVAESLIGQYIQNLPEVSTDPEALLVDSHAVLKSIEFQHGLLTERAMGIYSFSHLTFHEYFTAKNILDTSDPAAQQAALRKLIDHIFEKRWREVFLLVVERMDSADYLLTQMKQSIDQLLGSNVQLQQFLAWVNQKSHSVNSPYKPVDIRAFYFAIALNPHHALDDFEFANVLDFGIASDSARAFARAFACICACTHSSDITLDIALARTLDFALALNFDITRTLTRSLYLNLALALKLNCELQCKLQQLKKQLPDHENLESFKQWWESNGQAWIAQLREVMVKRNISFVYLFSDKELLQQYYDANKLLMDCIKSDCVSRKVREEIERALFMLPRVS